MLLTCFLFLYQISSFNLTESAIIFFSTYKENQIFLPKNVHSDISYLAYGIPENYQMKDNILRSFAHFIQNVNELDSLNAKKELLFIKQHYFQQDKEYMINFLECVQNAVFDETLNLQKQKAFLKENKNKPTECLSYNLLYYILNTKYSKSTDYKDELVEFTVELLETRKRLCRKYATFDIRRLGYLFNVRGMTHLTKQLIFNVSGLTGNKDPYFLEEVFINNAFEQDYRSNQKLLNSINLDDYDPYFRHLFKIYSNEITTNYNLDDIKSEADKNYIQNRYVYQLLINEINTGIKNPKYINYLLEKLETFNVEYSLEPLKLSAFSLLEKPLPVVDSLYKRIIKTKHEMRLITNPFDYSRLFFNKDYINYYGYKAKHDPGFVINEILKYSITRHTYINEVLPKINKSKDYQIFLRNKDSLFQSLGSDIDTYIKVAKLYQLGSDIQKTYLNELNINQRDISNRNLQEKLMVNESLLIFLKGSFSHFFIEVNKSSIKYYDFDELNDFLHETEKIKFIIIDNFSLLKNKFSSRYYRTKQQIPNVRYLFNLNDFFNQASKNIEVIERRFYGVDKPFKFNDKVYTKLFYVEKEMELTNNYFRSNSFLNMPVQNLNFESEMVHFSGHFLKSDIHPIFNRLVYGYKDKQPQSIAGFQIAGRRFPAKFIFLNACETSDSYHIDDFNSQKQLANYFLESGIQGVLVSTKKIDDKLSAEFAAKFYQFLSNGYSTATSLKLAQNYVRANIDSNNWDIYQYYGQETIFKPQTNITKYAILCITIIVIIFFFRYHVTKH